MPKGQNINRSIVRFNLRLILVHYVITSNSPTFLQAKFYSSMPIYATARYESQILQLRYMTSFWDKEPQTHEIQLDREKLAKLIELKIFQLSNSLNLIVTAEERGRET